MTCIHVYADELTIGPLLRWLADECAVTVRDIACCIRHTDEGDAPTFSVPHDLRWVEVEKLGSVAARDDIIIVAGDDSDQKLARLFSLGYFNVYNGNEMIRRTSAAERLVNAAGGMFVGPVPPADRDTSSAEALRFAGGGLVAGQIPRHKLFLVNSVPKSGTLWMTAMLARILGVEPRYQIMFSHVADMESDWPKGNLHGSVMLVRDLRDVVVSWFHDVAQTDLSLGFSRPRYNDIAEFYWQFFLGTIQSSDRYYRGNLCYWIDRNCASYVPLVRYEDMRMNPYAAVEKVLNAWRIEHDAADVQRACEEYSFDRIKGAAPAGEDYLSRMFRKGHLRRGEVGCYRTELPLDVSNDIDCRFGEYQQRLGYAPGRI